MDFSKEEKCDEILLLHPDVAAAIGVADDDDDDDDSRFLCARPHISNEENDKYHTLLPPTMNDASVSHVLPHNDSTRGGGGGDGSLMGSARRYNLDDTNEASFGLSSTTANNNIHINNTKQVYGQFTTSLSTRTVEAVPVFPSDRTQSAPTPFQICVPQDNPPLARVVSIPQDETPQQRNDSGTTTNNRVKDESGSLQDAQVKQLRDMGFSDGLIKGLNELRQDFPLRYWLMDNSGSMFTSDGCELRGQQMAKPHVVECTRWMELQASASYHASLAGLLGIQTVFRLLNKPEQYDCPQEFVVADPALEESRNVASPSVTRAQEIMSKIQPKGFTPLTMHLDSIRESIQAMAETLRSRGQQAVVLIVTDGLPTNADGESNQESRDTFRQSVKALQALPVWTVFRLCTDDVEVVEYYSRLDRELEYSVEVIDDYFHEAMQVAKTNPWLNYTMVLHRCREMGFKPRVFDLLNERLLNKDELVEFLRLIFGERALLHAPNIHTEWRKFISFLQGIMNLEKEHYNLITKKKSHWIDVRQLNKCYSSGGSLLKMFGLGR